MGAEISVRPTIRGEMVGAPLPVPPPQTAWGREVRRTFLERDRILLSPLQFGGERPGEGGRPRTQFDALR